MPARRAPGPVRDGSRSARGAIPAGLRTGDGLFETLRTYSGRPFLLDRHLDRLRRGARAIGLTPLPSMAAMRRACEAALDRARRRSPRTEWIVRPMIYASATGAEFVVSVDPFPTGRTGRAPRRVPVGISSYRHPGPYLVPPGSTEPVKWLARGPLAHALREARRRRWEEGLLEDGAGRPIEGTRSNLLVALEGVLISPGPESGALPGITRAVVLEEARRQGLAVLERAPSREELGQASEVMITSSLMGLVSVSRVEGRWPGSRSTRTPIASALRRAYAARVRANE